MRCPRKGGRFFFHLAKASAFAGVLVGIVFGVFAQTVQEPVPDSFESFLQSLTTPLDSSSVGTASFSVSGAGAQPNFVYRQITNTPPPKVSAGRAISADGRYVALYSTGDLVPGGNPDGNFEVFRFDAQTGQMTQVTNTAFDSANPAIRADGSQMAFVSTAELVPGRNTDHSAEIFLFDQFIGFQQLTDTDSTRFSTSPSMSADGLRIVFESTGNLDSNPLNRNNAEGVTEVFLYDALTGNIEQLTNSDNPALDNSVTPRISADGSRVVFLSSSDNLIFNPEHSTEVIRVDLATNPRQFVPITGGDFCPSGNPIQTCWASDPSISSDGRRVAFISDANLPSTVGNADGSRELFLWDQPPPPNTPVIRQVTNLPGGPTGPRVDSSWISGDGLKVAFDSNGDFDPTIGNADGNFEIFLFNDSTGSFEQVTKTTQGIFESNKFATISADARVILFMSDRDLDPSVGNSDSNRELFLAKRPNQPPALAAIGPKTVNEGQVLSFPVSATDPDTTDTLTLSATNLPLGASFPTVNGTGSVSGTFNWTPDFTQADTYPNVRFTVSDGSLEDFEDITITVQDANQKPTLQILDPDVTNDGYVDLANDILGVAFRYQTELGDPPNPGGYVYDPAYDFNGDGTIDLANDILGVAFGYQIACWPNATDSCPPGRGTPGIIAIREGQLLLFYVTGTDPEGQPLTFTATGLPTGACFDGRNHDGTAGSCVARQFRWTPSASQGVASPYEVGLTATDGSLSDTKSVVIKVTDDVAAAGTSTDTAQVLAQVAQMFDLSNELPVMDPIVEQTVVVSGKLSVRVSATDPTKEQLTLTATLEDGRDVSVLGAAFTDHGDGTGTFTWTPTAEQVGTFRLTFTATDPIGLRDAETIPVTVLPKLASSGLTETADPFGPRTTDALPDTTTLTATFNRSAAWTLTIQHPTNTAITRTFQGTGTSLSQLWGGRYWNGSSWVLVPLGVTYNATLSLKDSYGSTTNQIGQVTVK